MNENDPNGRNHPSRRRVLRNGALVASVGAVGLPALAGTAAATTECPRSPGYWKNNWPDSLGERIAIPPAGTMTKGEIHAVLWTPPAGDTVTIMAKHYVATYLNLLRRPDPDLDCANWPVAVGGVGTVEWEQVKDAAQTWLRLNGWDGGAYSGHYSWSPSVSVDDVDGSVDGEAIKDALDAFNNATFSDLDCDCGTDEPDSTEERGNLRAGNHAGEERGEAASGDDGYESSGFPPARTGDDGPESSGFPPARTGDDPGPEGTTGSRASPGSRWEWVETFLRRLR